MFSIDNLGEKTLNKIAEMALMSQINEAKKLTVEIKTDPTQLAKGMLNSLAINGEGLVMNKSLRMQAMRINLDSIAVKPFPALLGNIQLTQPSQGTIDIVFNESDLENILKTNSSYIENINCQISQEENIKIYLKFTGDIPLYLKLQPKLDYKGLEIEILEVGGSSGIAPESIKNIIQTLQTLLNLEQFQLDGVSVKIQTITPYPGLLKLQGIANISHFPKT